MSTERREEDATEQQLNTSASSLHGDASSTDTTATQMPNIGTQADAFVICRCGKVLPHETQICPDCGRALYRVCYCQRLIPRTYDVCPYCGAQWYRRKRRRRLKGRKLYTYIGKRAGMGLLIGLLIGFIAQASFHVVTRVWHYNSNQQIATASDATRAGLPPPPQQRDFLDGLIQVGVDVLGWLARLVSRLATLAIQQPLLTAGIFGGTIVGVLVALKEQGRLKRSRRRTATGRVKIKA